MRVGRPLFLFLRIAAVICATVLMCAPLTSCVPAENAPPLNETGENYTGKIFFENRRYSFEGDKECITAEDDALVIKKEGVYLLTGKLTEGRVITDAPYVRLVLDGVEINSSVSSAVESRRGTLIIESGEDSLNIFRSKASADGKKRGVIHTDGDLFLIGKGRIVVSAPKLPFAVVCHRFFGESGEASLTAEGGIFTSEARIGGGKLTVSGGKTGVYAYGGESGGGIIEMTGGSFVAVCEETAFLAENQIILTGGERDVRAPKPYVCIKDEKSKE